MNKYISIITLNDNGLNAPIKRRKVAEWIRKHDLHICCLQETQMRKRNYTDLKSRVRKQDSKWTGKKSGNINTYIRQNRLQNKSHKIKY